MVRRRFLGLGAAALVDGRETRRTAVSIKGSQFLINGRLTYAGRSWKGHRIDGLLMNSRMAQGIFDDENPETAGYWKYPDTGKWDPERNTREFIAAIPKWRRHGLLAFDICLQGGNPKGYLGQQPWRISAYRPDGSLKPQYMNRLKRIVDKADELGMIVMLCLFYFGQDQHFTGEDAIRRAIRETMVWLSERGYSNVLVEMANECNNSKYDMPVLKPDRIPKLFETARKAWTGKRPLLLSVSFNGNGVPPAELVSLCDYALLHGNGVEDPARIRQMVEETRESKGYREVPIVFNEDDHYDFDKPQNNMVAAVESYASWGLLDIGENNYRDGYQSPPVNWGLNTERKQQFFRLVREITGSP